MLERTINSYLSTVRSHRAQIAGLTARTSGYTHQSPEGDARLRLYLTLGQWCDYNDNQGFNVRGRTGTLYRILVPLPLRVEPNNVWVRMADVRDHLPDHHRHLIDHSEWDPDIAMSLCTRPLDLADQGDYMLAQKLFLEADDKEFMYLGCSSLALLPPLSDYDGEI